MSKFEKKNRLNSEEQQKLLLELCHALVTVKKLDEAANLLIDLFSKQEIEMIAKRLKIAKLLIQGQTYSEIEKKLKVSSQTVARVNGWLEQSGAGYRLVAQRGKDIEVPSYKKATWRWDKLKRKYPMYYWPQILLEEVVCAANNRQRKKLLNTIRILKQSGQKNKVIFQIENILKTNK